MGVQKPKYTGGRPAFVYLPHWVCLTTASVTIAGDDAQHALTIPDQCQIIEIRSEDGKTYWDFGPIADSGSPGYIPADGAEIIGPMPVTWLANAGVTVWVASDAVAHIMFWRETTGD